MLRRTWMPMVCVIAGIVATACSPAGSTDRAAPTDSELTACREPRPEICTAHYDPVCGHLADGTFKTYSNACSACSDKAVPGHRPGACE